MLIELYLSLFDCLVAALPHFGREGAHEEDAKLSLVSQKVHVHPGHAVVEHLHFAYIYEVHIPVPEAYWCNLEAHLPPQQVSDPIRASP